MGPQEPLGPKGAPWGASTGLLGAPRGSNGRLGDPGPPAGAALKGRLHWYGNGAGASQLVLPRDEELGQLLRDVDDESLVESVDVPQRVDLEVVVGNLALDLIDDR